MPSGIRSNTEIVVYVLAKLKGSGRKTTTEEIAYEAFQLAPDRFSWVLSKFQNLPDKEVARIALEDAAKEKYGALVEGKYARDISKDGWVLTPKGIQWLKANEKRIVSALGLDEKPVTKLPPREVQRLRARITREQTFQIYSRSGSLDDVSRFMFTDMLQCSPDAPPDLIRRKFNRLLSQAELAQDSKIIDFLHTCQVYFQSLFEEQEEISGAQET